MSITLTSAMSLPVPAVGSEAGPQYATDINNCLTIIDTHNHAAGSGVQINPAGLNINAALTFQSNPATDVSYVALSLLNAPPSAVQSLYVQNGSEGTPLPDLWYFDGTNNVQITSGGLVNATAASIPGESYGAGTFTWKQGAGSTTPANFDIGSITIRPNIAATTFGTTIAPSPSLSSSNTVYLPATIPASTKILQLDAAGNILSSLGVDNSSIIISSNNLTVGPGGITGSMLATTAQGSLKIATLTGSGTWTPPANTSCVMVFGIGGGGGGGGGAGSGIAGGNGGNGGNTTFGSLTWFGGAGGYGGLYDGSNPGTYAINIGGQAWGGSGGLGPTPNSTNGTSGLASSWGASGGSGGGHGGPGSGGGGGGGGGGVGAGGAGGNFNNGGSAASANSGAGGGGGGGASDTGGAGGSAGGSGWRVLNVTPGSPISYAVGSGGSAGAQPGPYGVPGGAGGSGLIIVAYVGAP